MGNGNMGCRVVDACRRQLVQPAGPSPLRQRWLFCWRFSRNSRRAWVYCQLQPRHFHVNPGERFLASLYRTSIVKSTSSRPWISASSQYKRLELKQFDTKVWSKMAWVFWSGSGEEEIAISRHLESNNILVAKLLLFSPFWRMFCVRWFTSGSCQRKSGAFGFATSCKAARAVLAPSWIGCGTGEQTTWYGPSRKARCVHAVSTRYYNNI